MTTTRPTRTAKDPHFRLLAQTLAVSCLAAAVLAFAAGPTAAREADTGAADVAAQGVVAQWNTIAMRTIVTEGLTPIPVTPLYLSFTSVAMYDAVVVIRGGFEPYALKTRPPGTPHASAEVAAATAAYTVLKNYFPASAANLDRDYAASLA
jgi:hypothetical protein